MSNCIFYIEFQEGHATIEDCQLRNDGQTYPANSPDCYRCPNKITRSEAKTVLIDVLRERANRNNVHAAQLGRWKKDGNGKHYCSSCGKKAQTIVKRDCFGGPYESEFLSKYCPDCGAKLLD